MQSSYRYSRWDGTQKIFELDQEWLIEEMSDELLAHGNLERALSNLLQRGLENSRGERIEGLRDLMDQLKSQRQQNLDQYNLDSMFGGLKDQLKDIVEMERHGIDRLVREARQRAAASIDKTARPDMDPRQIQKLLETIFII